MSKLVKTKCPECGARIEFDAEGTEAKCAYCGAVSRVEKQKPPRGQQVPRVAGPVVYVSAGKFRPIAVILPIVMSVGIMGLVGIMNSGIMNQISGGIASAGGPGAGGAAGQGLGEHMQWQGNFQPMLADVNGDGVADPIGWVRFLEGGATIDHIAAFDAVAGGRLWMTPPLSDSSQSYNARAALAGDKLVVADPTGVLRAFSAFNGQLVWTAMLGERAERICGAGAGFVRVETTDKRALTAALANGQLTPAGTADNDAPCTGVQNANGKESLYHRVAGGTWNEGGVVNPEIAGMDVELVAIDAVTGTHVALGNKDPGTRVPMAALYDAAGVSERRKAAAPRWMTVIPSVNPLTVKEGPPSSAAISQGRLVVPYELQGSEAGSRLACLELATGRNLWEVQIPNTDSGTMGAVVASDRMVFVSHWTWLDVFDLGTGQHRMTIGVW